MILFYNLLLFLILVPALFIVFIRYIKRFNLEFISTLPERFAVYKSMHNIDGRKKTLWIHCASLGEIRIIESMAVKLESKYNLVITVLTSAARAFALKQSLLKNVYYAPLDFTFIVQRLINVFKPAALVIVETELWPGMIWTAKKNNLKTILINGRLSDRSFPKYKKLAFLWKRVLNNIDIILARSQEDLKRFEELGYPKENLKNTGNLKYDTDYSVKGFLRRNHGFKDSEIILLCASTRGAEEELILDAWQTLKKKHENLKIIIAPRHVERAGSVLRLLEDRKIKTSRRSLVDIKDFDCLLIDTFGELQKFYEMCDIVFVGGSLVNTGGQNPIEPAGWGIPVLFGPHMQNFSNEAKLLKSFGGALEVSDKLDLVNKIDELLLNKVKLVELGIKAKLAVESQKGSMEKTLQAIDTLLELQ
jgi:3-deoxy-D-manno-octulosonic-acid transferase